MKCPWDSGLKHWKHKPLPQEIMFFVRGKKIITTLMSVILWLVRCIMEQIRKKNYLIELWLKLKIWLHFITMNWYWHYTVPLPEDIRKVMRMLFQQICLMAREFFPELQNLSWKLFLIMIKYLFWVQKTKQENSTPLSLKRLIMHHLISDGQKNGTRKNLKMFLKKHWKHNPGQGL